MSPLERLKNSAGARDRRQRLHRLLPYQHSDVIAACRAPGAPMPGVTWHRTGDMNSQTPWELSLAGVNAVIHLAGRAHVIQERTADPERAFMTTNHDGTKRLA